MLDIELTEYGVTINKIPINEENDISRINSIIGSPSSIEIKTKDEIVKIQNKFGSTPSNIYKYDDLGIIILQNPLTLKISQIKVEFYSNETVSSCKKTFRQKLKIGEEKIYEGKRKKDFEFLKNIELEKDDIVYFRYEYASYISIFEFNKKREITSVSISLKRETNENPEFLSNEEKQMLLQLFSNDEEFIKLSKAENFNLNKAVGCIVDELSKKFTRQELSQPSIEVQKKRDEIFLNCRIINLN